MLVCKFCEQPIYETELEETYPGIWIHMRGKHLHIKDDAWACEKKLINKDNPNYEIPKCHICKTETNKHGMFCSACGYPPFHAMLAGDDPEKEII